MFDAPDSEYLVPFDGTFRVADVETASARAKKGRDKDRLQEASKRLDVLQQALYANDRRAILLVFQGMDAAGKDSTIRAVMRGINPAGCQVFSFKKPSDKELDHDFLWRTSRVMPERGRIGIFNRSQYEEVLVVRVHPEILDAQQLPDNVDRDNVWEQRYESIRDQEKHLARNGTVILKFWLNVSADEQKRRFLARLDNEDRHWKFNPRDVRERAHWEEYMQAYEDALNATSRPWAPWYAIPADDKPFMRATIAEIVVEALQKIGLTYPQPSAEDRAQFDASRKALTEPGGQ
jgi:PPK2 family polyphosphate:nucleotide phosphotransferase